MGSRKLERTSEGTGSLATHLLQLQVQLVHDQRCTADHSRAGKKKIAGTLLRSAKSVIQPGRSFVAAGFQEYQHQIHPVLEENN